MTGIDESYRIARRVTLAGIGVSGMLACSNIIVGFLANSTSVVATGFEFAGDVLASSIVLVGMGVAARPADKNHPYGHGRFETLSAFAVGVILAAAGVMICFQSLQAVGAKHDPPGVSAGAALVGAIVLRGIMSTVKFRVGRRLRSSALLADGWNDAVDILSALAALTAVGLANYDPARFLAADHYGGFVVGIVVVVTGIRVGRDASLELVDTMPQPELTGEIVRVAGSVVGVRGIDKVFARKTGLQYHIDLHIEVDPTLTVAASHAIGGHVRATLKRELPWVADVLVHVEPSTVVTVDTAANDRAGRATSGEAVERLVGVMAVETHEPREQRSWYSLEVPDVLFQLTTAASGLRAEEARHRLEAHGPNELEAVARHSPWHTLASQFKNVLVVILLVATALSALLGHGLEAAVIAAIVSFAVLLGFIQEYRAERALEALREMAAPVGHAIRDGVEIAIPARELVPGDVIVLRAGDRVPADARIALAVNLAIDEAALTGESAAVEKTSSRLDAAVLAIGDRRNMAYAGTLVTRGRGQAVVVATGMGTEFGQISRLVQTVESGRTPLQENLDRLGSVLGKAALVVVAVIVAVGLWRGMPPLEMFIFGIALAVAVVPEALPAVVTISLAIGVRRMVKRQALVRRLPVVETLGSTSTICSDKTGTLTKNEMTVRRIATADGVYEVGGVGYDPVGEFLTGDVVIQPAVSLRDLLLAAALSSDARVLLDDDGRWRVEGDPTEGALIVAAEKAGLDQRTLNQEQPRRHEVAFTSERRRMTTLHDTGGAGLVAYSKGAVDAILPDCPTWERGGRDVSLDESDRAAILVLERDMASAGLRVLAVARKQGALPDDAERHMTWLGLVGMMDPPRAEARAAVQTCWDAGITPVMITGDHPLTATAIAKEIGLLDGRRVVSREDLSQLTDDDLSRDVDRIGVYARVSPADKLRVVAAWQRRGDVVAMTGDGVNDAPALKKADVGITMGISGTDVSKEAASVTLLDDNFATIVAAVEEGRIVFSNIRKYLMFLLSSNVGEILLMAGAALGGLPLPLTAVQILYVNLATDGLPALALAVDPPEPDLMQREPRDPRAGVFTRPLVVLLLTGGFWSGLVNIGLFAWLLRSGRPLTEAMAMTFASLVLIQFFKAYNYRSDRFSVIRRPFANRWLNLAVGWEIVLLVIIVYVPFLQQAFGTFAFAWSDWALTATLAFTIVPVLEAVKWLERRGYLGELQ